MFLRLKTIRRALPGTIIVAVGAFLGGCGPSPVPQFMPSSRTQQLPPEIRDGMAAKDQAGGAVRLPGVLPIVEERFGTLAKPAVWPLLPVDFGGSPAKMTKVVSPTAEAAAKAEEEEKPLEELILALAIPKDAKVEVAPGSQAAWTPGAAYEGKAHRVKAFDAKTGQVTLVGKFEDGLPADGDELLLDPGSTLVEGQKLYARHCIHCHGPGGAGDGPTAKYLDPKPRDYRLGIYKFTSTGTAEKASREDLADILRHGIPGTSMPAFRVLENDDPKSLHALVEYVRWLSMRGEYENGLAVTPVAMEYTGEAIARRVAEGEKREEIISSEIKDFMEADFVDSIETTGEEVATAWASADTPEAAVNPSTPRVADTPESRERGRQLFLSDRTKCASCHGPYGRGDGPGVNAFWPNPATGQNFPRPGLHDAWENQIKPRDLTQGVFRGGRRPIDVYRRVYAGIKGTPMSAFGGTLKDEEIWDIVNFVLHAPYESLPEAGRGKSLVSSTAH